MNGIELIKKFEGFSPIPYRCPANYLTIGYGHVIKKGESYDKITLEEAEEILSQDFSEHRRNVTRLIKAPLTENQINALASFVFNLGARALQSSTLRMKLNRGEYFDASLEFPKWVFAGGRKLKGLIIRREAERQLFLS